MNKKEKYQIIQKIDHLIIETKEKIKQYKDLTKPIAPENAIGRVSRMDAINNKSVVEAALIEAENKLNKLIRAKSMSKDIDFCICKKCRKQIPIGRILIKPESQFCVNCAF